jgi:hypothetical protein
MAGVPNGAPKLGANGPGVAIPAGGSIDGGAAESGEPGGSKIGPSPQPSNPAAPAMGTPPPQLLQHSQGQQALRARNMLIR